MSGGVKLDTDTSAINPSVVNASAISSFNHFSVLVKIAFLQSDAIKNSLRDQHPILNLLAKVAMWSYKLACDPSGPFFFSNPL